jgi:hypothetical protein
MLFVVLPLCRAQNDDRDRDRDWDRDRNIFTRLSPGTIVPVRTQQTIDVEETNYRVYPGVVDQDVRGENGRLAIPAGSPVELVVRTAPDNDLILDLDSVTVNGQRYAVQTDPKRVEHRSDNSLVGAIVGAVSGAEVRGRAVRIPRDTLITFRLEHPLHWGVADRGYDRDGVHYHDWDSDREPR